MTIKELQKRTRSRFWSRVDVSGDVDDCWTWLGWKYMSRYGNFSGIFAHRFAYEDIHGIIPVGLEIDHLCRNKPCVNPYHLEAVTHAENMRRWANAR